MKKTTIIVIFAVCWVFISAGSGQAGILWSARDRGVEDEIIKIYFTKRGYVASTDEALLDRALELAVLEDQIEFNNFVRTHPHVFLLKGGLLAHVERSSWPGKIKIKLKDYDISIWTLAEAIE